MRLLGIILTFVFISTTLSTQARTITECDVFAAHPKAEPLKVITVR